MLGNTEGHNLVHLGGLINYDRIAVFLVGLGSLVLTNAVFASSACKHLSDQTAALMHFCTKLQFINEIAHKFM